LDERSYQTLQVRLGKTQTYSPIKIKPIFIKPKKKAVQPNFNKNIKTANLTRSSLALANLKSALPIYPPGNKQ